MRKVLPIVILVLFNLTSSSFGTTKNDAAELLKLQHGFFDAIKSKNYDAAIALLANDYVGVYADGIIDREHERNDLRHFPLADYEMSQEKVIFPDPKTALVTFRLHVKVVYDGKNVTEDDNLEVVWSRQNKRWLIASQAAVKVRN